MNLWTDIHCFQKYIAEYYHYLCKFIITKPYHHYVVLHVKQSVLSKFMYTALCLWVKRHQLMVTKVKAKSVFSTRSVVPLNVNHEPVLHTGACYLWISFRFYGWIFYIFIYLHIACNHRYMHVCGSYSIWMLIYTVDWTHIATVKFKHINYYTLKICIVIKTSNINIIASATILWYCLIPVILNCSANTS